MILYVHERERNRIEREKEGTSHFDGLSCAGALLAAQPSLDAVLMSSSKRNKSQSDHGDRNSSQSCLSFAAPCTTESRSTTDGHASDAS